MKAVKISSEEGKVVLYVLGGIVVLVLVIMLAARFFGGMDALLQALGLGKSKQEKKNEATIEDGMDDESFNPNFYKQAPAGSILLTTDKAKSLAYKILASVGLVWDESSEGLAAIKQCTTQAQISQVANAFYTEYNRDLIKWLENKYDTYSQEKTLALIIEYSKSLPKF